MSSEHLQLERDLRDARTAFDDVPVSPDAWQRNQELVAAGAPDRRRTVTAVAAAVAVLLVLGVSWLAFGGDNRADDVPGSDGRSDSSSSGAMADPVQVAKIDLPDGTVTLEVGMEEHAEKADEPSFCYEMNSASTDGASASGAGGCTSKVDRADLPGVTVDYLTGSNDEVWTTLTGAVDERTQAVTVWLADGTSHDLDLVPFAGRRERGFGMLLNAPAVMRPQRVVAYGRDANVVESVDLNEQFSTGWLTLRSACAGNRVAGVPAKGKLPTASVDLGTADAQVSIQLAADDHTVACIEHLTSRPLAGWFPAGGIVAAVVGPEVDRVRLAVGGTPVDEVQPTVVPGSPWKVAVLRADSVGQLERADLVAFDAQSFKIDDGPAAAMPTSR